MAVSAARLTIRAPPGAAARSQALAEEALRLTSAGDDPRLVVVRRLALGRVPASARPPDWQAAVDARLRALTARAVHAATPGAAAAEAVWFRSPQEAMALLLAELTAGRTPSAWYWPLALPDWRGATLAAWLPRLLAAGDRTPETLAAVAQAFAVAAQHGWAAPLVAALPDNAAPPSMAAAPALDVEAKPSPAGAAPATGMAAAAATGMAAAATLLARLPSTVRATLLHILAALPAGSSRAWQLARLVMVAAAPELAARPTTLAALATALASKAAELAVAAAAPADAAPRPAEAKAPALPGGGRLPPGAPVSAPQVRPSEAAASATVPRREAPDAVAAEAPPRVETGSAAAGLWLLVRPLEHLGLPDWLASRPELATAGFGRALLGEIARRQRTPDDDPVFVRLGDTAPVDPALLTAWRVGLDRWLRRRTGRKLATIVHRRGWLSGDATVVTARFRLDQADIALRRRALDVDPGWTGWLGLTIAYQFRDDPVP